MVANNLLSPETRALIRAQMSRRGFIARWRCGAAGLLAACGTDSSPSETSAGVVDLSDKEKVCAGPTGLCIWITTKMPRIIQLLRRSRNLRVSISPTRKMSMTTTLSTARS